MATARRPAMALYIWTGRGARRHAPYIYSARYMRSSVVSLICCSAK
ncbi:Uncharacterised protein [Bordetella pertussis]|nr:Uncharacterised protein [Bordetella pertussis]CFW28592.1 Uncharacterised protein [Bordetella pertussis]